MITTPSAGLGHKNRPRSRRFVNRRAPWPSAAEALDVHVPLYGRRDRAQLNIAVLGNRSDTCGQTTCQPN